MKLSQLETLNKKDLHKGIIYFSEYYFINREKNLKNLLKSADYLRKTFKVENFIILGYFDQDEVLKFLENDFCKTYEANASKLKSSFFDDEEDNGVDAFNFEIALIDYANLNNAHSHFGNSNFFLALDKNNKIIFSSKKYFLKTLMRIVSLGFGLSLCLLYIFLPSIENLILIE